MTRDFGDRSDSRRPRRDRDRGRDRGRDRDRDRDPAAAKERIEKEFAREIEMRLTYFLQSEETELEFEAMNSYRRRVVHEVAKKFGMESESRGEDRERYVCAIKTSDTPAPGQAAPASVSTPAQASEAAPAPAAAPPRVRLWDFGNQTFPVNPGKNGVHMALKSDGSLEILRGDDRSHVLTDRMVTTREFRVRQGKILVPGDAGY